jgi:hypothetical protein
MDIVFIGAIVVFAAICWAFAIGCAKLGDQE